MYSFDIRLINIIENEIIDSKKYIPLNSNASI